MKAQDQIQIIFNLLKQHLRDQGISYKELASRTHMSEANVKRIFSIRSCDLERLMQFCEAAELRFFDLMAEAAKSKRSYFQLRPEVEEFFSENFDCFVFFRELMIAKDATKAIAESKRPREQVRRFLSDLEKQGLISKIRNVYKLRSQSSYLAIPTDSKLRRKLEQKWIPWFLQRVTENSTREDCFIELFSTDISEVHREELVKELFRLLNKYREIGDTDQRIGKRKVSPLAMCIGVGPHRIGVFN